MIRRILSGIRSTRTAQQPPSVRPRLETLEERAVPAGIGADLSSLASLASRGQQETVYVESNNPNAGQNAVLAFRRSPVDGSLTQIGTFATGGTGQLNIPKAVGPDDGDHQVAASPDGKFLYAVNQGSNSITAFRIKKNGGLEKIGTFSSGGVQPDSIGIANGRLYVANRGDASTAQTGTVAPNVTGFSISGNGALAPIPNSTVSFPVNTFAVQALASPDGRFLFAEVASVAATPISGGNTITPLVVGGDGSLSVAPGGAVGSAANAVLLGSAFNPNYNILYAGFASAKQIGVYTFDETGRTSYVGPAADQGSAPCWCVVSADGRVLYAANTTTDSIGVFSLADPLHPVQIQEVPLRGPVLPPGDTSTRPKANVFEISLDPSGRSLYAVSQTTDPNFSDGNQLHTLVVARDGTLSEPSAPVIFNTRDVPANAHPQGVAVVATGGKSSFDDNLLDAINALLHRRQEWTPDN